MNVDDIVGISIATAMTLFGTAIIIGAVGIFTGEIYFLFTSYWAKVTVLLVGLALGMMMYSITIMELGDKIIYLVKRVKLLLRR